MPAETALDGLKIVDLTEALAGPYCTMLLADLGADVTKIERPGQGEQSRAWGARTLGGESAYFYSTNRNKRGLALDFQKPAGRAVLHKLLAQADVFVCNLPRLDSLRRAEIDPETLQHRYPRLIVCTITGYGHTGPNAGRSGYDLVAQGEAGLMSLTGPLTGEPARYPVPLADMATGLYSAIGILAALQARQRTGRGQWIDNSLLESQAAWGTTVASDYFANGQEPRRVGNQHPSIVPYQVFQCRDKAVVISVGSERLWARFCEVLGFGPEVRDDPRYASNQARLRHRAELIELLEARLQTEPADHWLPRLRQADIPCGPINTVPEVLADPHYLARSNVIEMEHPAGVFRSLANPARLQGTPPAYRRLPPSIGQHSAEILAGLGYSAAEIAQLRETGVI